MRTTPGCCNLAASRRHGSGLAPVEGPLMRVALIHNRGAGGSLTPKKLHSVIEAAGHELVRALENVSDLDLAAEDEVDVVAVAGGDGTVRSAVRALAGKRVPSAI